jgi:hypothetical protein
VALPWSPTSFVKGGDSRGASNLKMRAWHFLFRFLFLCDFILVKGELTSSNSSLVFDSALVTLKHYSLL